MNEHGQQNVNFIYIFCLLFCIYEIEQMNKILDQMGCNATFFFIILLAKKKKKIAGHILSTATIPKKNPYSQTVSQSNNREKNKQTKQVLLSIVE